MNDYLQDERVTVVCPHCGTEIERDDPPVNSSYLCPACGEEVSVDISAGWFKPYPDEIEDAIFAEDANENS